MTEGESNQQPCEGVMDKVRKQRAWGDVTGMEHKINKMGLKRDYLQQLHVSEEVPTRHHYREVPQTLSRKSTCLSEVPVH